MISVRTSQWEVVLPTETKLLIDISDIFGGGGEDGELWPEEWELDDVILLDRRSDGYGFIID